MANLRADELRGRDVQRKRDGAIGRVVDVQLAIPSVARPGKWGKTIVTVRYRDEKDRKAAGGDSTGDLAWFRSNFKVLR